MAIDTVHGNRTVSQLQEQIVNLCEEAHLSYDGKPPTPVSPGVYMFYASSCDRWGACRQRQHFAVQLHDRVILG